MNTSHLPKTRPIPSWPGNYPDYRGCLGVREMVAEERDHTEAQRAHIWACPGCEDCRDFTGGEIQ
ncbi:hypothetical protein [Segeticoccus rhizosphaerae]|uniref:hypothetical protein n=1 Tax=Segeticoccus rhizosphaerae TaxID=1104777 RepID=UPI0013969B00|nr:hypothetical protein [Segeticoccus rhizosphaerae]